MFLQILAGTLAGIAVLTWACVCAREDASATNRSSKIGCALWLVLLVVWLAACCLGFVDCDEVWQPCALSALLGCGAAVRLVRPALRKKLGKLGWALRLPLLIACVPVAFLLIEVTYSDTPFEVKGIWLNFAIIGTALLAVWFAFQRRMVGASFFLLGSYVWGAANYFLSLFKGQTVLPSDVVALGTAMQVRAGYSFVFTDPQVAMLCLMVLIIIVMNTLPQPRPTRLGVPVHLACALAISGGLVWWYNTYDLRDDYGVVVDVWATRDSYMEYGSVPCFLERLQEIKPKAPTGYSSKDANSLQEQLASEWDEENPGYDEASEDSERPCVIAIMNESFSDLSLFEGVEGYESITERLKAMGITYLGCAYDSASGGGTCNSEFEFLTGSTLGSLGGGVYPYMHYDLSLCESLPKYFSALGYDTTAIHPAASTNWRRDVVYQELGFDTFLSQSSFEGADTLRDLVRDYETYDAVLDILSSNEKNPQFVFDVTIQNHGGYNTGALSEYQYSDLTVRGQTIEGMDEYLTCMEYSMDDLQYLLDELSKLDRKVVVIFFGDHQPGFNDELAEASMGVTTSDMTIEQTQERYSTPWFIWSNYDLDLTIDETDAEITDLSLGYLGSHAIEMMGLPLTQQQKALLRLEQQMPVANLNGYQAADGTWYWNGQASDTLLVWSQYKVLQYANLFDGSGNAAFKEFVASGA